MTTNNKIIIANKKRGTMGWVVTAGDQTSAAYLHTAYYSSRATLIRLTRRMGILNKQLNFERTIAQSICVKKNLFWFKIKYFFAIKEYYVKKSDEEV